MKINVICGVSILLIGVILISSSNVRIEKFAPEVLDEGSPENPQVSADLKSGEFFDLYITPGGTWAEPPLEPANGVPYDSRFVWINVSSSVGMKWIFEFAFGVTDHMIALYEVNELTENMTIKNSFKPGEFRLKAENDGRYQAVVWQIIPPPRDSFGAFQIRKLNLIEDRPFGFLLYVGLIVLCCGVTVLLSAKIKYGGRRKRRKHPFATV